MPRAADALRSGQHLAVAAALVLASCSAAAAGAARRKQSRVQRLAEEGSSFLDALSSQDREDKEEAERAGGQEAEGGFQSYMPGTDRESFLDTEINEEDLAEWVAAGGKDKDEAENSRFARQVVINLSPSKKYVNYIARKHAQKNYARGKNINGLEVQIALITEVIRNLVLHCRENKHDYKCRVKLVSKVAYRRLLLDKLSAKDLEAYIKIREELKIRHVYRMQALIGRLGIYKYGIRDRKQAPGRKVLNRLKKSRKLLTRRLATQLRQGKNSSVIHLTKKKITSRKWTARAYDEAKALVAKREVPEVYDPLNLP